MTLGLLGGLVGAATGVAGAAVGTAAGLAGAAVGTAAGLTGAVVGTALNAGAQVIETAVNIADEFIINLARLAVTDYCKTSGSSLRFSGVVDAKVTVGPDGKTYRLLVQAEVNIGGLWVVKTHEAVVHCPPIGLPSVQVFHCIETN